MRQIRIYQSVPLQLGSTLSLDEHAARHVGSVLRMTVGQRFYIFNGSGTDFLVEISNQSKKQVEVKIISAHPVDVESPLMIHLAQGISKGDRMDIAIQKSVELGVTEITPIICERSVVKMNDDNIGKKMRHWESIIISACEQSGRSFTPTLHPPTNLPVFIQSHSELVILDPEASFRLSELKLNDRKATLIIGPEGGLAESEIAFAKRQGATSVMMGKRILRTETAPMAAISALQSLFGDF